MFNLFQTLFKTLAISFSTMTLFTGITPLYGSSLAYGGPATLVWGWVVVSFFTWFVGLAMAEICSSFPVSPFSSHFFGCIPWSFLSSNYVIEVLTIIIYKAISPLEHHHLSAIQCRKSILFSLSLILAY